MFILTYSLKLIAESAGIEPNTVSRTKQLSRLSLSPSRFTLLKNFSIVGVTGLEPARLFIMWPSSQNWSETNYRLHPDIIPKPWTSYKEKDNWYSPQIIGSTKYFIFVGPEGHDPPTLTLWVFCSDQLNYRPNNNIQEKQSIQFFFL